MKDAWQFLLISGRHLPFAPHDSILKENNPNSQKNVILQVIPDVNLDTMQMTSGPRSTIGCVMVHVT